MKLLLSGVHTDRLNSESFNNCQKNSSIKQLSLHCSNWDNNPAELNPFQNVLDVLTGDALLSNKSFFCCSVPGDLGWDWSEKASDWESPATKQQPALCAAFKEPHTVAAAAAAQIFNCSKETNVPLFLAAQTSWETPEIFFPQRIHVWVPPYNGS